MHYTIAYLTCKVWCGACALPITIKSLTDFLFLFLRGVKELLPPTYMMKERGKVTVKGKGEIEFSSDIYQLISVGPSLVCWA